MQFVNLQQSPAWSSYLPAVTVAVRPNQAFLQPGALASRGGRLAQSYDQGEAVKWYERAKRKVQEFDALAARAARIANLAVREDIQKSLIGDPSDSSSGLYARNAVAYNVSQVEDASPANYRVYAFSQQRNRVERLDDFTEALEEEVGQAERLYGLTPEPTVVTQVVESPLTVPLLLAGGIVAAALLLS